MQSCIREVVVQAEGNGTACPPFSERVEYRACNQFQCPSASPSPSGSPSFDPIPSSAPSAWSSPSPTASPSPSPAPSLPPNVDCQLGDWSPWSSCELARGTCGEGSQYRERLVVVPRQGDGAPCSPDQLQVQNCTVPCAGNDDEPFIIDDQACNNFFGRIMTDPSATVGVGSWDSPAGAPAHLFCNWVVGASEEIDITVGYVDFTPDMGDTCQQSGVWILKGLPQNNEVVAALGCQTTPEDAKMMAPILVPANKEGMTVHLQVGDLSGGRGFSLNYTVRYPPPPTQPKNCTLGPWSDWSQCNATCGDGYRFRTRPVLEPEEPGGWCGDVTEMEPCNDTPCPSPSPGSENCEMTGWSPWEECSAACDGGVQSRNRSIVTYPSGGGEPCGSLVETRTCNSFACLPLACQGTTLVALPVPESGSLIVSLGPHFPGFEPGTMPAGIACNWEVQSPVEVGHLLAMRVRRLDLELSNHCATAAVRVVDDTGSPFPNPTLKPLSTPGYQALPTRLCGGQASIPTMPFMSKMTSVGVTLTTTSDPFGARFGSGFELEFFVVPALTPDPSFIAHYTLLLNGVALGGLLPHSLFENLGTELPTVLGVPAWRVPVTYINPGALPTGENIVTVHFSILHPADSPSSGKLRQQQQQQTVSEVVMDFESQLRVNASKRSTMALWNQPVLQYTLLKYTKLQYAPAPVAVISPQSFDIHVKYQPSWHCGSPGPTVPVTVQNSGPDGSMLSVTGAVPVYPWEPKGWAIVSGLLQVGTELGPGESVTFSVGALGCAAQGITTPQFGLVRLVLNDPNVDADLAMRLVIDDVPNPSPQPGSSPTPTPPQGPQLFGLDLVALAVGAGMLLMLFLLVSCGRWACARCCVSKQAAAGFSKARLDEPGGKGTPAKNGARPRSSSNTPFKDEVSSDEGEDHGIELTDLTVAMSVPVAAASRSLPASMPAVPPIAASRSLPATMPAVPPTAVKPPAAQSLVLQDKPTLEPSEFEGKWAAASTVDFFGGSTSARVASNPEVLEGLLRKASIECIASGEINGVFKSFFFAKEALTGRLLLAEVSLTRSTRHLSVVVKAEASAESSNEGVFSDLLKRALSKEVDV
jgi:hypothetical protein